MRTPTNFLIRGAALLCVLIVTLELSHVPSIGSPQCNSGVPSIPLHCGPPLIARALSCEKLSGCERAYREFNQILRHRFPVGGDASLLTSELTKEGFRYPPHPQKKCVIAGDSTDTNVPLAECPAWDPNWNPKNKLSYVFRDMRPICAHEVAVIWSADSRNKILHVQGFYSLNCR
jgi:hypothetical protein